MQVVELENSKSHQFLASVYEGKRGLLWDRISDFNDKLKQVDGAAEHHTEELEEMCPLKHHIEDGLYTREVFMPAGTCVVSFIHKQAHPSFCLEGRVSVLQDDGSVKEFSAGDKTFTKVGTQRVFFVHEDTRWCCVYRTDKTTVEEAEKDVYAMESYKELPQNIIDQNKLIWQE